METYILFCFSAYLPHFAVVGRWSWNRRVKGLYSTFDSVVGRVTLIHQSGLVSFHPELGPSFPSLLLHVRVPFLPRSLGILACPTKWPFDFVLPSVIVTIPAP